MAYAYTPDNGWHGSGPEQQGQAVIVPDIELVVQRPAERHPNRIAREEDNRYVCTHATIVNPILLAYNAPHLHTIGRQRRAFSPHVQQRPDAPKLPIRKRVVNGSTTSPTHGL